MAQLKGRHTHAQFIDGGSPKYARRMAATADRDRLRLIHECLRDLAGVELIYAIRCPDGIIKIGHTADLMARRRHFASSDTPEALLAIQPGTYEQEQDLHRQLRASVAHGKEYYHPTEQVMAVVNAIRSELGVQPIAGGDPC